VGLVDGERFVPVARLPGWTRGLAFRDGVAFVGTSRVLPRFSQYAPGLDRKRSVCGVHALDAATGRTLGSIVWPYGNQIFALEGLPTSVTTGFPFHVGMRGATARARALFYGFLTNSRGGGAA